MKKGIIYCRVSTTEQAEEGVSLQAQERLCNEYAQRNEIEVEKVFIERGESAKTINRPELQKMMKYCKINEGKVDTVLIYKIDRLSRDSHDYGGLKIFFAGCGVEIVSITEPIQDTPMGRFFETVLAANAQMDNEIRGDRTKLGMIEALKQGRYVFHAPYGYKNIGGRGSSNIEPIEAIATKLNLVFKEIIKGDKSQEEIRQYAKLLGLTSTEGKIIPKATFYKILRNPVYKGYIEVPSMGVQQKGSFKPIVKPEIFDAVQALLDGRTKKLPIYKKIHPDFPLRGLIKCTCGKTMTSNWSKGKGGQYGYYRCSKCKKVNIKKKDVEGTFVIYLQDIKLKDDIVNLIKTGISLNWEERNKELTEKVSVLERHRKTIKVKQNKIIDKNLEGIFGDEVAKRRIGELEKELSEIEIELLKYDKPKECERELIDYSISLLRNMSDAWIKMNIYEQNKFQKFIFPKGLVYKNGKFTTSVKPFTVEMNEAFEVKNSIMVTLQGIEP